MNIYMLGSFCAILKIFVRGNYFVMLVNFVRMEAMSRIYWGYIYKLNMTDRVQQGSQKSVKTHLYGFMTSSSTLLKIFVGFEKSSLFFQNFFSDRIWKKIEKSDKFIIISYFSESTFYPLWQKYFPKSMDKTKWE